MSPENKVTNLITTLLLMVGGILTAWGLVHLSWPQALPWSGIEALIRYLAFIGVCTVLVVTGSHWCKRNPLIVGAVIAFAFAVFSGALWPLIVVFWFALASSILGRALTAAFGIKGEHENWLTNLLVGAGLYGTAVGFLAHFPANYPGVYGAALVTPFLLWRRSSVVYLNSIAGLFSKSENNPARIDWLSSAIAVIALTHFVVALMPELGHDALAMHLFIPAHMASRHQWGFEADTYVWAVMPMLGDWIFSIGYMLAGETGARLVNISFILFLGWLVRDLVLWAGGTVHGAKWATLIFLSTPLTFTESSKLFIESVWAVFVVAGTLTLLRLMDSSDKAKSWIALAALFFGFAAATKAVTLTIIPIILLVALSQFRVLLKYTSLSSWIKTITLFLSGGLIPYLTSWLLTGNPVFPFFNGIFQSPYYPPVNFDSSTIFGKGITWDVLYRATFDSGKYLEATVGASGFQWLLLFLPAAIFLLLGKEKRAISLLLIGVFVVVAVFQSVSYFRYAFPAFAILAAAIGLVFRCSASHESKIAKIAWGAGAISTVFLNFLFLSSGSAHRDFPLVSIFDQTHRETYLQDRLPLRNAVDLVNKINLGKSPVAVFAHPMTAGIESDALYSNWYNFRFQSEVNTASTVNSIGEILLRRGVDFVILDSNWSGAPEKRDLIANATDKIADYGTVSVRKVRDDFRFKAELLTNPAFTSIDGWSLAPGVSYDPTAQAIIASVTASATQAVSVSPGQRYLNSVVARCYKETSLGRVQINWLDGNGQFIRADIKTFDCTPDWSEQTMEVTAPLTASVAIVYASGHTTTPIQIQKNSFRQ